MDEEKQTGCSLGILDQLSKNGVEILEHEGAKGKFKKFQGVCMYRRAAEWEGDLLTEVFIPATFVIIHTGEIEKLAKTVESLLKVKAPKSFKTIVCHDTHDLKEIKSTMANLQNSQCVYLVDKIYKDIMYDEAFKRAKNGWVFFVQSGHKVPEDYLEVVNYTKNSLLHDFVAISGEIEGYMAIIYKALRGCSGTHIKEKVQAITQKELYENYRNLHRSIKSESCIPRCSS
jgi:hypothetical protein